MKIGTKSVLFGAHCFFIHPWFVAWAWWRLYGFPWDPRLWTAFFVHDLGYWGKPNMDGEEGELHPHFGANVMRRLFDHHSPGHWHDFTLYHSRFLAKKHDQPFSRLCVADKLAIVLTPSWMYIPTACLTGEIHEYRAQAAVMNPGSNAEYATSHGEWHRSVKIYVQSWVDEHKDGKQDTWTRKDRQAIDKNGVWE